MSRFHCPASWFAGFLIVLGGASAATSLPAAAEIIFCQEGTYAGRCDDRDAEGGKAEPVIGVHSAGEAAGPAEGGGEDLGNREPTGNASEGRGSAPDNGNDAGGQNDPNF
jgi:hypothetical protein